MLLACSLVAAAAGCRRKQESIAPADPPRPADSPAAPSSPPVAKDRPAAAAGRIEGTVTYAGAEIPERTSLSNGTDPQICGATMVKEDIVISASTRGIKYVLVWLEDVNLPEGYRAPPDHLVVDNVGCQFVPHAAVATVGSTFEAKSSDPVLHTTHLHGAATENLPLPTKGSTASTKLRQSGLIKVLCDKHGWMEAFIRVDPHPYHAVTDADGKFLIAGVPPGTYKLKVWHERFSGQERSVTVEAEKAASLEIKYPMSGAD
jgi:hypothetical protein